jgi:hypothetical protein
MSLNDVVYSVKEEFIRFHCYLPHLFVFLYLVFIIAFARGFVNPFSQLFYFFLFFASSMVATITDTHFIKLDFVVV